MPYHCFCMKFPGAHRRLLGSSRGDGPGTLVYSDPELDNFANLFAGEFPLKRLDTNRLRFMAFNPRSIHSASAKKDLVMLHYLEELELDIITLIKSHMIGQPAFHLSTYPDIARDHSDDPRTGANNGQMLSQDRSAKFQKKTLRLRTEQWWWN